MKPEIDFYFDKKYIYLTYEAQETFIENFLSPSELKYFFTEESSFSTWFQIFIKTKTNPTNITRGEAILNTKREINSYLKAQFNLNFLIYGFWEKNISLGEQLLRGAPDGLEFNSEGEVNSVLGIKFTKNISEFSKELPFYLLELYFFMYLSKAKEIYLCTTSSQSLNLGNFDSADESTQQTESIQEYSFELYSPVFEKALKLKCETTSLCNNTKAENNFFQFLKIQIEIEEFNALLDEIKDWYSRHKYKSPCMSEEEYLNLWTSVNGIN